MKAYFFVPLLLIVFFKTTAQEVSIKSSPEVSNPFPQNFWTQNLGADESGYYLIRDIGPETNPKIILEKYDFNFNLLFSKDIESSSGILGNSKNHFKTILGNKEILVFLASWNKENKEGGLWVQRFSTDGEKMGDEIQLLSDTEESFFKSSSYKISLSKDGSYIGILTEPTFDKNALESFRISIFSTNNFSKIAEKEFTFSVAMERYPRNEVLINNNGVAFGFKTVKVNGKEYKYYLASLAENSQYQEELDFKEYQLNQSKFIINTKGELVGIGILAELKKYITLWQKTWVMKANSKGIIQNKIEPLGAELLSNFMSEKKAAKEGAAINYFQLKDVLEKPEGGYLLIAEQLDERKTALPTQADELPVYNYRFNYGGIVLISFNESADSDWSTFYDKEQKFESLNPNMELGSFAYGIVNNKFNIIWNYTDVHSTISFPKRHWIDKSGNKIAVVDVFGNEAAYPTFLTSFNLKDGSLNNTERTFSSLPLADIQRENNFSMAVDPSIFFNSPKGIVILSRMKDEMPRKYKFSRIGFGQ